MILWLNVPKPCVAMNRAVVDLCDVTFACVGKTKAASGMLPGSRELRPHRPMLGLELISTCDGQRDE